MSYKLVSFFGKYSQCEHHEVWTSNNTKQLNGNLRKSSTNKVGLSPSKKICVICLIERPLKMMRNALYFILKALLLSRYLRFCHDFLVVQEKWLDQIDKITFKIHDVITWLTNNCGTYIVQYVTNKKQADNETWSINRI